MISCKQQSDDVPFIDSIVHTTLYIGLSGVDYVERHSLHKETTPLVVSS